MRVEVTEVIEHKDGSLTVMVNMDQKCMIQFAKIGLVDCIMDAAETVLDGGYEHETLSHAEITP
jgi:hypothetical protein